jgi:hypothetical protein
VTWLAVAPPQTETATELPVSVLGKIKSICCTPEIPGAGPA